MMSDSNSHASGTRAPALVMMNAVALRDAIHARAVSCVEVMTAYLDHIERLNPLVNAIVALRDRGALLADAKEKDAALARGEPAGPLHGFPFAVKDLAPVKGMITAMGSPILKDFVAPADSVMVERLRKAGAIIIGKTNTPEFGLGSHTYNPVYGATRNAYDQTRSAGGSSGGAAVGLALRMLPLADGSDYGGSLRNPAGWNNVFGFRTSYGRVPADGRDAWLPSMGVLGPMARDVPDLAMLLSVQSGYDDRVPLSMDASPAIFKVSLEANLKGKRIAWLGDFDGYLPYEPGVLDICKRSLDVFEQLGCIVEEALPDYPVDKVWRAWLTLRAWQSGGTLLAYYSDPAKRAMIKPEAIFEIESGLKLSAYDITAASAVRTEWYQAVRRFFQKYDYAVIPTAQLFPFDVDLHWPKEIAGRAMTTYHEWMKGVLPITMAGCPALAAPAGFNDMGLPIGIQIAAPNHGELACLQLAHAYDAATQWSVRRVPGLLG
ncbi:MAG TPA: amidase [Xanthobacteraceae bacterium]|nr:amidase [Xanthobacteraceae bacterium]